ncbi:methyl-accepting chemotaxis protein [Shewanella sp. NFH-SH190041]|uniref:methyl-accepting chemotaxis protein n=1 Tax=Shewanella sp. NFH-SH190041 TaxID=2950245 RepID=UPI0021C3D91A|nr:methyl-accepting chemotaxis protein [Shewanella sp. NFH-SH190041]
MHLRHLAIGKKLAMAFASLGIILFLTGIFSLSLLRMTNTEAFKISSINIPSLTITNGIRSSIADYHLHEQRYFLQNGLPQQQAQTYTTLQQLPTKIEGLFNDYERMLEHKEEIQVFHNMERHWQQYYQWHQEIFNLIQQKRFDEAEQTFLKQSSGKFNILISDVDKLVTLNGDYSKNKAEVIKENYSFAQESVVAITLFSIALVLFFAVTLTRQIRNPLTLLVEQARMIAQGKLGEGELCRQLASGNLNNDETGQLAVNIRDMKNDLRELITGITASANQLNEAVEEMTAISDSSAKGMTLQQNEIIQVVTAMNEMQLTLQEVSRNTTEAANAANHAMASASKGTDIVRQAVNSIGDVSDKLDQASTVVQQLEQDSQSISMVLDVIRGIADQTNLLALNAAIEAARAGEQGRGFAVVSDEVRMLAQRTQDSTAEISKTIEQLQARTAEANCAMQTSRSQMQDSLSLASQAGESITSINQAVSQITDMNTQIASATEEQTSVAEELNHNLTNIQTVSEENNQGIQHTAATCQDLSRLATGLLTTTGAFDIG